MAVVGASFALLELAPKPIPEVPLFLLDRI
jgi:hypothetical protein